MLAAFTRCSEDPTHSGSAAHALHTAQEEGLMVAHPHRVLRALAVVWHSVGCGCEGRKAWIDGHWEQHVLLRFYLLLERCISPARDAGGALLAGQRNALGAAGPPLRGAPGPPS